MGNIIGIGTLLVGTVVVLGAVLALPTMWLWNALCPQLFHLPPIGFWQALGLNMLCGILFRSSGLKVSS